MRNQSTALALGDPQITISEDYQTIKSDTPPTAGPFIARPSGYITLLCLLLACIGASWFAIQTMLIPQPRGFLPNWQNARWIQASDTHSSVSYFRYQMRLDAAPDSAFVTITANQVFRLYVNGIYIGTNRIDFVSGDVPETYMFDVSAVLHSKDNAIGLRVLNIDQGTPQVRARLAAMWGQQVHYYGTNPSWRATGKTTLAHPRNGKTLYDWSKPNFDANQWPIAQFVDQPPPSPLTTVNPLIYQQSMPTHWLSAGPGQESYFVRQITIPAGTTSALLRIVATGEADIFINNHLYTKWNGQINVPQENVVNYLDTRTHPGEPAPYRNGLLLGVYDISPDLDTGTNTIAIHVLSPGTTTAKVGLETIKSTMSIDMLLEHDGTLSNPLTRDALWHASTHPTPNWIQPSNAALNWPSPQSVGRPGASHAFYLPDSNTPRNSQSIPLSSLLLILSCCIAAILISWLLLTTMIKKRISLFVPDSSGVSHRDHIDGVRAIHCAPRNGHLPGNNYRRYDCWIASLTFLPALALEALLIVLTRCPQIPQPFPYTWQWGLILITIVILTGIIILINAQQFIINLIETAKSSLPADSLGSADSSRERNANIHSLQSGDSWVLTSASARPAEAGDEEPKTSRLWSWIKSHWGLIAIMLIAIPMVCYDLGYEPYWQDELASHYAALGILAHGYPSFPSGFIYPKGELYSYLLALVLSISGPANTIAPRIISVIFYILSLPLLYMMANKLFNRRIAWLATAMLAFSPYAMIWARQERMYEQAQFMVIVVIYLFFRALQQPKKILPIYLAMLSLLIAYFSHEETFIILPALLACVLIGSSKGSYHIPAVLRNKHWWIAAIIAIIVIGAQLSLTYFTHPPVLGTDQSQRPEIQLTLNNIPYYFSLLFIPKAIKDSPVPWVMAQPLLILNSLLAILGCLIAFYRKEKRACYCALLLLISSATLIFVFTMQADRYYYPLLPIYYLMGSYAFWSIIEAIGKFPQHSLSLRIIAKGTIAILCAAIVVTPMLPISNFNLLASRLTGVPYHRHYADYDDAANYIKAHMQAGDIVITVSPAAIVLHYVGHVEYFFSIDRALFLIEQNGQLVETTTGAHAILNEQDFQSALATYNRIWLISDNGAYQGAATRNGRFIFPPADFLLVYEGYGSAVYFRSSNS